MKRSLFGLAGLACLLGLIGSCGTTTVGGGSSASDDGPPVFTSSNHLLDLLVIAEPKPITLGPFQAHRLGLRDVPHLGRSGR